ncbi:DUF488 domain-containing protein [Streptomyces sp. VRA16 Mangrove soil]|uniref:DUF488 domain-containing protein n=1 Tax=Streptomyces sp. VRA16 Mangrove soil TaxID=2817434 RepID=UPI001A9D5EAB|nr:DUF488 family protein [Streptomyces sp. VRA16 Mangrove soil]MBO1332992.1 DUF488 family protein [Streptomyces sp. VRA16 Mangrove soil]
MSNHAQPDPFAVRRVYDPPAPADGTRVLVDRLWPRGISKERAAVDEWLKDIAPSKELRTWYHEDREGRYEAFAERYDAELTDPVRAELVAHVRELGRHGRVTLVTSVKEVGHSHVPVLVRHLHDG